MGRIAVITAIIVLALLAYVFLVLGLLSVLQDQADEVPLWLRHIETGAGIFEATTTGLAIIIGGIFAYYRFFKEETYSERLQPTVSTTVSRKDGAIFIKAIAEAANQGQTSAWLDMSLTRLGVSTRKAGIYGWSPGVVEVVFTGNDHIRPGETMADEVWMEIPDDNYVAIQLELRIARAKKTETTEDLGWIARDIVSLVEDRGKITDAPNSGIGSEG